MRILLVEDEKSIRDVVKLNLDMEGYETITSSRGDHALKLIDEQHFDLMILDIMLPEKDGIDICQRVRLVDNQTPIIFITAKNDPQDRIHGLKVGADDYLTKPFELEELLLRVQNLLKRSTNRLKEELLRFNFGANWVDFTSYEASGVHGAINLTKKEVLLLKLLIDKKNEVVSRKEILQKVWGYEVYPSTRSIDNFILAFRKYFEDNPKDPIYFQSIRGIGYKFVVES